jgi:hypothetical protein
MPYSMSSDYAARPADRIPTIDIPCGQCGLAGGRRRCTVTNHPSESSPCPQTIHITGGQGGLSGGHQCAITDRPDNRASESSPQGWTGPASHRARNHRGTVTDRPVTPESSPRSSGRTDHACHRPCGGPTHSAGQCHQPAGTDASRTIASRDSCVYSSTSAERSTSPHPRRHRQVS